MARTLLACFAHPDDESFGSGGVLAKYASEGVEVHLVCATLGEEGEIAGELATPENLAKVRQTELETAADILGITSLQSLGYRDSGMAGSESNRNPRAFVNAAAGHIVPRLVRIIRRLKPNVVLTFDEDGGYGHPDHIAIHYHTVAAVQGAGEGRLYPEAGEGWAPDRLFFTTFRRSSFADWKSRLAAEGFDVGAFERPDMPILGSGDEEIDAAIDVRPYLEVKRRAIEAHRTQLFDGNPLVGLPDRLMNELLATEHFKLGWGKPLEDSADGSFADDLFAGL